MYSGYLICPSAVWLKTAVSQKPGSRFALVIHKLPDAGTGDPVFCAGVDGTGLSIPLHCRISFAEDSTVREAWAKFGSNLGASSESELLDQVSLSNQAHSLDEHVTILVLLIFGISPPLPLKALNIHPIFEFGVMDLSPSHVLEILKMLPPEASTDWTKRVIERNNDLPTENASDKA